MELDKTGITNVKKPGKIIATKGASQVSKMTRAKKGQTVTVMCKQSASGNYIHPVFLLATSKDDCLTDKWRINWSMQPDWMDKQRPLGTLLGAFHVLYLTGFHDLDLYIAGLVYHDARKLGINDHGHVLRQGLCKTSTESHVCFVGQRHVRWDVFWHCSKHEQSTSCSNIGSSSHGMKHDVCRHIVFSFEIHLQWFGRHWSSRYRPRVVRSKRSKLYGRFCTSR